jgi:hypothetical protein
MTLRPLRPARLRQPLPAHSRLILRDPVSEGHRLAEVAALLEEHRSGMQADVGGRQANVSDAV